MDLIVVLEKFFESYKKQININKLITKFNIKEDQYDKLIDILYYLEKEGKIIGDNNGNYIHISKDYYLYKGILNISTKNNYYINLGRGNIIIIPQSLIKDSKVGDTVYVEKTKNNDLIKSGKPILGKIVRTVKKANINNSYMYKTELKRDKIKRYYYILNDDRKIYIPINYLNGAYEKDLITVQIFQNDNNKYGKVINVIKRDDSNHVFVCKKNNDNNISFIPIDTSSSSVDIEYSKDEKFEDGEYILAKFITNNKAIFVNKIDREKFLTDAIYRVVNNYNLNLNFADEVIKETIEIDNTIKDEEIKKRIDLRNIPTITIDGNNARDFDDAVSLEIYNNKYILYVSIADVSHYVKIDSEIFKEAYKRATSIYTEGFVIPMLPEKLSNDICSLTPNEDKLTKTIKIQIDKEGNILDYEIFDSIINSNCRMNYNSVNNLLDGIKIEPEYIPYYNLLVNMNDLSKILQNRRLKRGFLCFDCNEIELNLNEDGFVDNISERVKGQSQLIIENFMLLANEFVASFIYNLQLPSLYRNHERPSMEKLYRMKDELKSLKYSINTINNEKNPRILQKILLNLCNGKSKEEVNYISNNLLKFMNRAYYSNTNIGHYALALEQYTTFTSPIRRFPDLIVHIVISYIMNGKINELIKFSEKFEEISAHCNEKNFDAENFENNVSYILFNNYLEQFKERNLDAKIISYNNKDIIIKTINGIYGTIPNVNNKIFNNGIEIDDIIYNVGDNIVVKIDYLRENSCDIVFTTDKNSKILEKRRR